MADLIACKRGAFTVMNGCEGIPGKVVIDGFEPMASIIDTINIDQSVNVQFMTSLEESVYAYVFGDKMGSVVVSGTAFAGKCEGGSVNFDQNGLKDVSDFYNKRRASQDKRVLAVTFGPERASGFLTGLALYPKDPLYMLLGYKMTINTLPKKGK